MWKRSWPESFIVSIEQEHSDDGGALERHIKLNSQLNSASSPRFLSGTKHSRFNQMPSTPKSGGETLGCRMKFQNSLRIH